MKKFLSLCTMALVALLPFVVDAASDNLANNCTENAEGIRTCVISYDITDSNGVNSLTVTLTEVAGADIISVTNASDTEWSLASQAIDNGDGTWTVLLTSPDAVSGEYNLFTLEYKPSSHDDCRVSMSINGKTVNITPDEPKTDTPTDNKDTGATLPYVALGTIAVVAIGAYVATKNKSKMYKI